jgi:hypoxanthine phosphoribosyltransferase
VQELLRQMHQQQWKPDYVVGLTRGGLTPAVMISQYLDVPMHSLKVSLRHGGEDCESNLWMAEEAFGYVSKEDRGDTVVHSSQSMRKKILIVDDINDSGATMAWIKDDWESSCAGVVAPDIWQEVWGNSVRFAALVNNEASHFKDINYRAMTVNKNDEPQWIVFPWEEWWR